MRQILFTILLIISCAGANDASAQARIIAGNEKQPANAPKTLASDTTKITISDPLQSPTAGINTITLDLSPAEKKELRKQQREMERAQFVPDPQRALWLALIIPGAGQIYNRKYWKLPLVYGGFLGCTYAFTWNQQMYSDYSQAYLDIMDTNPETHSYTEFLPPNFNMEGREEHFKEVFKNRKNRYRRWRDLSAFCFVGVYILSVIDAYVDAQLSEFDITPDLTMRLEPTVIDQQKFNSQQKQQSYGIGCTLNF